MFKTLDDILKISHAKGIKKLAVAAANDEPVLIAVMHAMEKGIIAPILVGDKQEIETISKKIAFDVSKIEIIHEKNPIDACQYAVKLVSEGKADFLMKGLVETASIMRAVLDKDTGLRTNSIISHVAIVESKGYHKIFALTDPAMNIAPDLLQKAAIIQNAVDMFRKFGMETPKVAVVAAVEVVNPKMQATLDASLLSTMNLRGQIKNCVVEGPFALDNAISKEACLHKGITSIVGGDADILLLPDIEAGNVLYKSITFLGGGKAAGVILGAKAPIVLTSRADSDEVKLYSIACAAAMC